LITSVVEIFIEKNRMYFIDTTNFERLLKKLSGEGELFVPVLDQETGKLHIERVDTFPLPEQTTFKGYRTVETMKAALDAATLKIKEIES